MNDSSDLLNAINSAIYFFCSIYPNVENETVESAFYDKEMDLYKVTISYSANNFHDDEDEDLSDEEKRAKFFKLSLPELKEKKEFFIDSTGEVLGFKDA